nr:hypothetical transcript [Hymenolepis microstoma]
MLAAHPSRPMSELPPTEAQKRCLKELDAPLPVGVCHCVECSKLRRITNAPSEIVKDGKPNPYLTYLSDLS